MFELYVYNNYTVCIVFKIKIYILHVALGGPPQVVPSRMGQDIAFGGSPIRREFPSISGPQDQKPDQFVHKQIEQTSTSLEAALEVVERNLAQTDQTDG